MSFQMVFSFKDNYVDAAVVSKLFNKVKIKDAVKIEGQPYASEYGLNQVKNIREKYKIKSKKTEIILNFENIITRIIDIPIMSKRNLKSFVKNNINEYFAVNMEDYYYDYEVISIDKSGKDKKMSIMIAVVPRGKLKQAVEFVTYCGFSPYSIAIYPDCISNLFLDKLDTSKIIVDVNSGKSTITILDGDKIFLYSGISNENYDESEEKFDEVIENIDYFLNFYSSRHFGDRIDSMYLVGEFYNNKNLYNLIESHNDIKIITGFYKKRSKRSIGKNFINPNLYIDIFGSYTSVKSIYNKNIDFVDVLKIKKDSKKDDNRIIKIEVAVLFIITCIVVTWTVVYRNIVTNKYDTGDIEEKINSLSYVEETSDKLESEKKQYENMITNIKKMKDDEFDYLGILNTFRMGLPDYAHIKYIDFDKNDVYVVLGSNGQTVDTASIIAAINKMKIFEFVELPNVNLNDKVGEIDLNLKILDSYKGVDISGEK
jgi:type IV pilus assembly protein PilM